MNDCWQKTCRTCKGEKPAADYRGTHSECLQRDADNRVLAGRVLDSTAKGDEVSAADEIVRHLVEKQADDRAYRLATIAAEEFIRSNGLPTDTADEFVFHGADLSNEYFQDCVAHLRWIGECVVFDDEEQTTVLLGDFTMESLA